MEYKKGQFIGVYNTSCEPLYFVGYDTELGLYGDPLLILATDINNRNTYGRYSKTYIEDRAAAQNSEITAVWSITDFAPHYYNVHILVNGIYAGVGRFCNDYNEMIDFCDYYKVSRIEKR